MNTLDLIIKKASQKVSEALKGAEMIKEIPAETLSVIQDDIDPETVEIIEKLLSQEKTGSITIVDNTKRFDPITDTVGQLTRPIQAMTLLSEDPIRSFTDKDVSKLTDAIKDFEEKYPDNEDVTVYLGDTPNVMESIKSIDSSTDSAGDILAKTLSIPFNYGTKFLRSDHFNPISRSITVFTPSEEILRHELGHANTNAVVFGKNPVLDVGAKVVSGKLTGMQHSPWMLVDEIMATGTAGKSIQDKDMYAKKLLGRTLGAGLGTYTGGLASELINKFVDPDMLKKNYPFLNNIVNGALINLKGKEGSSTRLFPYMNLIGGVAGGLIGNLLGGHITLPGFSPKKPEKEVVIVEKKIKEAALNKLLNYEKYAAAVNPGFHKGIWDAAKGMFNNFGKAWGMAATSKSPDYLKNFGKHIWEGVGANGIGFKKGFQNIGNVIQQNPWPAAAYGTAGAMGAAGLGAAGLYTAHKVLK